MGDKNTQSASQGPKAGDEDIDPLTGLPWLPVNGGGPPVHYYIPDQSSEIYSVPEYISPARLMNGWGSSGSFNGASNADFAPSITIPWEVAIREAIEVVSITATRLLGFATLALTVTGDTRVDQKRDGRNMLLWRNMSEAEYDSFIRKGMNFGTNGNSIGVKEFWLDPGGLFFWQNKGFAGPYNVVVSVPQSVVGCYGLVQIQLLDGYPAGIVYPENLNAFNVAKKVITMYKIGQ